jgi:hypothetical protein
MIEDRYQAINCDRAEVCVADAREVGRCEAGSGLRFPDR